MGRCFLVVAATVLLASIPAGCRTAVPADASDDERVHSLLREFGTRQQLSEYLGQGPGSCVEFAPGRQLCEWILDSRNRAWPEASRAIATRDRVGVLCELPTSGAPREPDSCTIHQRRSNRDRWYVPSRSNKRQQRREELRAEAQALLDEARTLPAMSRRMGAAPNRCSALGPREQTCEWRADNHVYGHGTLAASQGEQMRKKMMLRCEFPLDGSPRAPDACDVSVGF